MAKNLIPNICRNRKTIVTFLVCCALGGGYFVWSAPPAKPIMDPAFVTLDSDVTGGQVLFQLYPDRPAVPAGFLLDESGQPASLHDFKGQSLLINFWATWCIPCRTEMPGLDALQAAKGGKDFQVILLSVDRGGLETSRRFLDQIGVTNPKLYYDEKGRLARQMKTIGYPSTILINKDGRQFGMLTGPAHWHSESARRLIDRLIAD